MLVRLIFNCTGFDFTQFLWNRDYKKKKKRKRPETTMIQNTFPVPSVSVYNKWTPEKLKKNHTFLNGKFFFSVFFFPRNKLRKYYTRFSFVKVDDQPVASVAVIHSMSEKRDWGTLFPMSLLMAIHVLAWGSLYDPTTNHKITLTPFNF